MVTDRSGQMFGPYRLLGLLGRGGMGEVYRAHDTEKDRVVAVKLLPPHLAQDPEYQARFRREAHAAARVQSPYIVPIHTFGAIDDVLFIEMAYVDGQDLGTLVRTRGPLHPAYAVAVVSQIAAALDAAHASGLVHRDVKPGNILLTGDHAYLSDFGIASTDNDTRMTGAGLALGSVAYMAPERFDTTRPVTGSVDVYALGCVLYESLTGRPPFSTASQPALIRSHLHSPPPSVSGARPDLPPALDRVLGTCLAKQPEARFPTARAFADAARTALRGASAPRPAPPSSAAPGAPRRRRWVPVAAAAAVALVVAGAIGVPLLMDDDRAPTTAAGTPSSVVRSPAATSDSPTQPSPSSTEPSGATGRSGRPSVAQLTVAAQANVRNTGMAAVYPADFAPCVGKGLHDSRIPDAPLWAYVDNPSQDPPGYSSVAFGVATSCAKIPSIG
ncbi:protein kinase [Luteipulveratus sp. YIM 133132]|uniref:serine/threonine-protein kinase n=1 Tax=Luteipulveratus flavus TaxID=3031728 RepID=UPI0023AFD8F4|nr:serine/threonine protein kinase [Luteipulveratus sp. YIM 133132]MDE9365570.1 protein kinase [Luteipulveratus sp. YIM 133132]